MREKIGLGLNYEGYVFISKEENVMDDALRMRVQCERKEIEKKTEDSVFTWVGKG